MQSSPVLCQRTSFLQKLLVESPQMATSPEWEQHLEECSICAETRRLMECSLKVYLHVENVQHYPIHDLQIWDRLQSRLTAEERSTKFYFSWKSKLAAASVIGLLIGMSAWMYTAPQQVSRIPARYEVVEMKPGEPVGSSEVKTRVIWNQEQFGLSIEQGSGQGHYSAISIGMQLTPPKIRTGMNDAKASTFADNLPALPSSSKKRV